MSGQDERDVAADEELAPHKIEAARSSRSRCRTCRRAIDKGTLRLGILLEGPYGTGYLWHHLTCAAKRHIEDVEQAYEARAWAEGVEPPPLDELQKLKEQADEKRAERKTAPWAERAPTGRARCRHCEETIERGAWRVALLREVTFGNQTRSSPINVHARCVAAELLADDCVTQAEGFEEALRSNSRDVSAADLDRALKEIGALGG